MAEIKQEIKLDSSVCPKIGLQQVKPLILETLLQGLTQQKREGNNSAIAEILSQQVTEDIAHYSQILSSIITQLKQKTLDLAQAREITAAACYLLAEYALNHRYQPGEEDNLKQGMQLLTFLLLGTVKISHNVPQPQPDTPVITHKSRSETEAYGLLALHLINRLFSGKKLGNDELLAFSSFYCAEEASFQRRDREKRSRFLESLGFMPESTEDKDGLVLLEQLGLREVMKLAEFQHRKNKYVGQKSILTAEEEKIECSPLELIDGDLAIFEQKLKDSVASIGFIEQIKVDFDADTATYLNFDIGHYYAHDKLTMVFNALTKLYVDGLHSNYQARQNIEQGIQFGTKAQTLYSQTLQSWIKKLSELVRLSVSAKIITTANGHKMKKTVLDCPLSYFFDADNTKRGKISQTLTKEKLETLPLPLCADLMILLYSNISETPNPLGQVHSLYAGLRDRLSFNAKIFDYTKNYLEERGFSSHQITTILASQEDV